MGRLRKPLRSRGRVTARALLALAPLGWAICTSAPAHADVIAIGDDGSVVTIVRPALYLSADMRPQAIEGHVGARAAAEPGRAATPSRTAPVDIAAAIGAASERHAIDPALASAVAWRESRYAVAARSPKGASGVMQLMPATARSLGVDPADPLANIEGGVTYLSMMLRRYDGDLRKALAAYNAGPGAVDRYGGVPPYRETTAYVAAILDRLADSALGAR